MSTLTAPLNDSLIKKQLKNPTVTEFYDPRYKLKLRVYKSRDRGRWYYVERGKKYKLAPYPVFSFKAIVSALPNFLSANLVDKDNGLNQELLTVNDVLKWHLDRMMTNKNMSYSRKINTKSAVRKHLMPAIGYIDINQINREIINNRFIWPMQSSYALSTVKCVFSILKVAFKQAKKLNVISRDPLAAYVFTDFIQQQIKPKPCALLPSDLSDVIKQIEWQSDQPRMLATLMLCCGTRVGETRQAKWNDFKFDDKYWFIPESNTKTRQELKVPLSGDLISLLMEYKAKQPNSDYVFSLKNQRSFIGAKYANELFQMISNNHWTSHDLRKLARTTWAEMGVDHFVGEMLLNHALSKLESTYIHSYADTKKREAINAYHALLKNKGLRFNLLPPVAHSLKYSPNKSL